MNLSDITDKSLLIAVTSAKDSYNNSLPEVLDKSGQPIVPKPNIFNTDEDYFDARITDMLNSWANQYETELVKLDDKITSLQTKRAEIVEKLK